jgi:hypothetical protein
MTKPQIVIALSSSSSPVRPSQSSLDEDLLTSIEEVLKIGKGIHYEWGGTQPDEPSRRSFIIRTAARNEDKLRGPLAKVCGK